ncbi:MAG: alpha-amylase, partial [Mycetocola sp.]
NTTGAAWLPQPSDWDGYSRDAQVGVPGSTLEFYREALRLRREHTLGLGSVTWLEGFADSVVAFSNGPVTVIANTGDTAVRLPAAFAGADLLLASGHFDGTSVRADSTIWVRTP